MITIPIVVRTETAAQASRTNPAVRSVRCWRRSNFSSTYDSPGRKNGKESPRTSSVVTESLAINVRRSALAMDSNLASTRPSETESLAGWSRLHRGRIGSAGAFDGGSQLGLIADVHVGRRIDIANIGDQVDRRSEVELHELLHFGALQALGIDV